MSGDDWTPDDSSAFRNELGTELTVVYRAGAKEANDRAKAGLDFDWIEPNAVKYANERGAELVGMKVVNGVLIPNPNEIWSISETTRQTVRDLVARTLRDGLSVDDFAELLEETGVFGEARAEMIARTELALAMNRGRVDVYREADTEYVHVFDGDYDEECEAVNDTIQTLDWWEANPIEHPNCLRDATPATRQELIDEGYITADEYDDPKSEDMEEAA